jgi:hypothetical protein
MPIVDIDKKLVGMGKKDAEYLCRKTMTPFRIVREDSKGYMITDDYRPNRINIEIDKGKVTKTTWG